MPPNPPDTVIPAEASGANSGAASGSGQEESKRSRKPANTKFKQQQLPAWQPMLTARSVLPFLVAIGVAFIPIGIALYLSASNVTEIPLEYTNCLQVNTNDPIKQTCANITTTTRGSKDCMCRVDFTVEQKILGPVFIYYALDNFFQNHRKYVKSRDDTQLMGKNWDQVSVDCAPFAQANSSHKYAPCGAIANSLFNDSIGLNFLGPATGASNSQIEPVKLLKDKIAWTSDRTVKFQNPGPSEGNPNGDLRKACEINKVIKPAYWTKNLWELDETDASNNGMQNEDFIVWMRTAAFPSFRKLYRRVNHTGMFNDSLPAGNYSLNITYNFPVTEFEGRKYVILSSVSWIGGRNPFLGIAYMTVGCACLLLAAVFFFIHIRWGKNHKTQSFIGLSADTPFARATVSSLLDDVTPDPSRSHTSSSRWFDTIQSSHESPEESSDSHERRGFHSPSLNFLQGNNDSKTASTPPPSSRLVNEDLVQVRIVSSCDGLRTGQSIHERLIEREIRMRSRQLMNQPVLVD